MSLWLLRHAPAQVQGVCYGRFEVPCAPGPVEAAGRVRAALPPVGLLWTSPLARCRELAAELARTTGLPLRIDERLAELSMGEWEGRTFAALEREDPERYGRWLRDWRTEAPPGGEALPEFRARVADWLAEARAGGVPALAVTHAGVIRALRAELGGLDFADALAQPVPHLVPERAQAPDDRGAS